MKDKKIRYKLIRIITTIALMVVMFCAPEGGETELLICLAAYLVIGADVLWRAVTMFTTRFLFNEHFLVLLASFGAFGLAIYENYAPGGNGEGDYAEAVAVMLLFQIGVLFQDYAVKRSRDKIAMELMDSDVMLNDEKPRSEAFITRFARRYTPVVCAVAMAVLILPPLTNLLLGEESRWQEWLYRALTVLVVSCPCALVISIPMSFFGTISAAMRRGIFYNSAQEVELTAKMSHAEIEECAVVVKDDDKAGKVDIIKRYSQRCMTIVNQNIVFSIGIKVACMLLAMMGVTNMWLAMFADTGVTILAVLNAMRAMRP